MSREWYRFFYNLFNLTGSGGNFTSLTDVQKGPPTISLDELTENINKATANLGPGQESLLSQIAEIEKQLNALKLQVQPELGTMASVQQDNVRFLRFARAPSPAVVPQIGTLAWNQFEQTADLGMDYGVVQQIGLEYYARVENTTGVTIPNGSVVGFAGVGAGNTLAVAPYLADGSTPTLYILGVMTHDLPNSGEIGYATVWGHVRGFDTTGTPVGETWSVGDILYASPTTAGAFTNVKPTAPDNVIPMAAVLEVDATDGEIFVRPTIEQQKFYGVFSYNGVDQSIAATYTPQAVLFDTTDIANGVSIGSPASRIVVAESGLYKFDFSMQIESNSSSAKKLWIWPRIDGSDVLNSNSEVTFSGSGTVLVPSWSWTLSLTAGQYFQIMIAGDSTDIDVTSKAAETGANGTPTFARPAAPGIILEVTEVQQ